ncbi:MAG: hypothetical protein ACOY90_01725 [Candidatus Zhuqueibacterota bacterium]
MLQDTENPWKDFANEVGGKYRISEDGMSLVTGSYRGLPFVLKMIFIPAAPKVHIFLTHFELLIENKRKFKLKIYREGIIQKLTKLFGTRDIMFNDRSFDKKYIVEGNNVDDLVKLFPPSIRATLMELGEFLMILDGDKLIYEESGKIIKKTKLFKVLELLADLAEKIAQ